jgi:hypothetical protein
VDVQDSSGATCTGVTPNFAIEPAAPACGEFGVETCFTDSASSSRSGKDAGRITSPVKLSIGGKRYHM